MDLKCRRSSSVAGGFYWRNLCLLSICLLSLSTEHSKGLILLFSKIFIKHPAFTLSAIVLAIRVLSLVGILPLAHNHAPHLADSLNCPVFILTVVFSSILPSLISHHILLSITGHIGMHIAVLSLSVHSVFHISRAPPVH